MRRYRGNGLEIPRLLWLLVTTGPGWIIIGIGLITGGLIWGLNSHQVAYVQGNQGAYQPYLSEDNGFVIFQQNDTNDYYIMHIPDYTPAIDTATLLTYLRPGVSFHFIASTDSVRTDAMVKGTGVYVPTAYPIEQIVFTTSQGTVTYTRPEYSGNPNGYTINNWLYASILILLGVLATGNSIFLIVVQKQRKQKAAAEERARLAATPSIFARELGETPSMQPYRGVDQ